MGICTLFFCAVCDEGLVLIRSRTTQAGGWEPVGIWAPGPWYPKPILCQENHLPACWLHLLAPSSFTTFSSFTDSAVSNQEKMEIIVYVCVWGGGWVAWLWLWGQGGLTRPCRLHYTPGWEGSTGGGGATCKKWPCRSFVSLYSMCFIGHYRGAWDVEMNGKTRGGGER